MIRKFPRPTSLKIIAKFSPDPNIQEVTYGTDKTTGHDAENSSLTLAEPQIKQLDQIRRELQTVFSSKAEFTPISRLNYTDGVRIIFSNGDVAHFRPSGNADELRIYSVADTLERADAIIAEGVREPDGLLRSLASLV